MCLQDLARRSFWQDPARGPCKIFQVLARPIICKMEQDDIVSTCKTYIGKIQQEYLSSTCKIKKDQCLARWSKMVLQDIARMTKMVYLTRLSKMIYLPRLTKMIFLPRLSKINQDDLSSKMIYLPRLSKSDQDGLSSKIKQD